MHHTIALGIIPSSVILSKTGYCKSTRLKERENKLTQKAVVLYMINPWIYNFEIDLGQGKFRCFQNATNQANSTVELGYIVHVPSETYGSTLATLTD